MNSVEGGLSTTGTIVLTIPAQVGRDEKALFDGIDTTIPGLAQYAGATPPRELADGLGATRLADARDFKITSARRVGEELFLVLHRAARKS